MSQNTPEEQGLLGEQHFIHLFVCLFLCFIVVPIISPFGPLPPSPPPISIVHPNPIVHVRGSFIYVPWLIPLLSFKKFSALFSPLTTVSLFHDSMLLVLFCSLVYFVHYVPLIGEIIRYLSFTDWLISLSIIFSSSIHAVPKGRNSFFLLHGIPLCKCTTLFKSTHLLTGTLKRKHKQNWKRESEA